MFYMKIVSSILLFLLAAGSAGALILPSGQKIDDAIVEVFLYYEGGAIRECKISVPTILKTPAGNLKVQGFVGWAENGTMTKADLAEP
jgi:hypothetical protein